MNHTTLTAAEKTRRAMLTASMLLLGCMMMLGAQVRLDAEHFPDPNFRAFILTKTGTSTNQVSWANQADSIIDTSKLTNLGSVANNVTDLTGIKYFDAMTTIDISAPAQKGLKFVDFRGMSKLSAITFTPYGTTGTSYQGDGNKKVILETVLLDGTGVSTVYMIRCGKLKHLSTTDCANLTTVYVPDCNLTGLDFTGCKKLATVSASQNYRMSSIVFDPEDAALNKLYLQFCPVSEIRLPATLSTSTFSGMSLLGSGIRRMDLSPLSGKTISGLTFQSCPNLMSCPTGMVYATGTWTAPTTTSVNVGYCDSFQVVDPALMGSDESVTNVTGGTYDRTTGRITFNEGSTTVTYTFSNYNKSNRQFSWTVTATRQTAPAKLYVEFYSHHHNLVTPGNATVQADGEGTLEPVRIPLESTGNDNEYNVNIPYMMGNFKLVEVNADGSETYLGSNGTQLSTHYPDWTEGAVTVTPGQPLMLHRDQPAPTKAHVNSVAYTAVPSHAFTTHTDTRQGLLNAHTDANLTVNYISGDAAGTFAVESKGVTVVNDILPDDITAPDCSDCPVEYYDLQGRRVARPSHGLYIMRQGRNATKIYLN